MISTPPPRFGHGLLGWIALAVALIAPWAWLVLLERRLRDKR